MRFCGNCGTSLSLDTAEQRICPSCGAVVNITGDIVPDSQIDASPLSTWQPAGGAAETTFSRVTTLPDAKDAEPHTIVAAARRVPGKLLVVLALAVLLLGLVAGSALLLNNAAGRQRAGIFPFGGDQQSTVPVSASQAAATKRAQSGPVSSPVVSPSTGTPAPGTETPTPDATATISPAPGKPALVVAPTKITVLTCLLGAQTNFTVTNTGSGVMSWSASASESTYKLSPASGSLDGGQQQTVTVSSISKDGWVTVVAPGAANSPQTVTITCTV